MKMLKESANFSNKILKDFEKVGLDFVCEEEGYKSDKWVLKCLWKNEDKIEILWHKIFTEYTTIDFDSHGEIVVNDVVIGTVEICQLLRQKFEKSAYDVIIDQFKSIASKYTGKMRKC